jgi:hypothetical protein
MRATLSVNCYIIFAMQSNAARDLRIVNRVSQVLVDKVLTLSREKIGGTWAIWAIPLMTRPAVWLGMP